MTEQTLRLVSCESLHCVYEWKPPQGTRITVAAANTTQVGTTIDLRSHDLLIPPYNKRLP